MGLATFVYTGAAQSFIVPAGVTSVICDCQGAQGQIAGGLGGRVQCTLAVTPSESLQINVGGQGGFGGGGVSSTAGGGASDIRQSGTALGNRKVVGGGGGGKGPDGTSTLGGAGGDGGGTTGAAGGNVAGTGGAGGGGGTPSAGGAGGAGSGAPDPGSSGQAGSSGQGGGGVAAAGGGGGGYFGGGEGGGGGDNADPDNFDSYGGGGGGGGSSFAGSGTTTVTHTQGFRGGNGIVMLSWTDPEPGPDPGPAAYIARPGPLGCGDYQAVIRPPGGGSIIDILQWTGLSFGRKVDDTSTASVTLNSDQARICRGIISELKAWKYELGIFRNEREVWAGPLRPPHYDPSSVTVNAADLFYWFEHRFLPFDRHLQADLAEIFATVVADALEVDTSPNITLRPSPTGILGIRDISGVALPRAADVLRELSRTGVDWTMVVRELRIGGQEVPTAPLATLTDDTLRDVTIDPVEGVSEVFVFGQAVDRARPIFGAAYDLTADIGTVQIVANEPTIGDNASATAAAQTRQDFYSGNPLFVEGILHPEAPIDFADLVPGARIDLALGDTTRGNVLTQQRLMAVDVTVDASDSGVTESVHVSLGPLGTVENL